MIQFEYKKLDVWKLSIDLVEDIYRIVSLFPKTEEYILKSQLRRASVSVSANISEGSARKSELDRKRFYAIARSSLIEIDNHLEIGLLLKFFKEGECKKTNELMLSIFRMLTKMIA